ncbi:glycosyltransferase [Fluviicola sp.]|jgi:UDP-N-acetylglucosamine:LPS N-acetylglucosamine transferase|uniref:glycosyltransferase n=1 Tax=Fluviicola sp. TaxID=1917219 RepID=UPI00282D1FAE|nr:glycosyltransferase [Fluviicola sp.]MDR0801101.1 hypothetical protein [Fluviicola sp.]
MTPAELSKERILFACLDWGSGHVARSVSLLKQLQTQKNELFISCTRSQKAVFELYGIAAHYLEKEKFQFRFKGDGNFTSEMRRNVPDFLYWVKNERIHTRQLVSDHRISLVLSDHCYGFYSAKVLSVFITHQVSLPPKVGWLAQSIHRKWMNRFDEVWIMDDPLKRLAGKLSEPVGKSTYIGFYSRFREQEISVIPGKIAGIVSGPEPYSEQLFHWIVETYGKENLVLVSPKIYAPVSNDITVIRDWKEADREIASAEILVSRNGYSTLMDLEFLQKKAVLIPTPGQLEQEYLATLHG